MYTVPQLIMKIFNPVIGSVQAKTCAQAEFNFLSFQWKLFQTQGPVTTHVNQGLDPTVDSSQVESLGLCIGKAVNVRGTGSRIGLETGNLLTT